MNTPAPLSPGIEPLIEALRNKPPRERSDSEDALLSALAEPLTAEEILDVRRLLTLYFGESASRSLQEEWDRRGITEAHLAGIISGDLTWDDLP